MSKMDGLRAMREARYAEAAKAAKPGAATKKAAPRKVESERPATSPEPAGAALCGHRAISGRTCTREHGHDAKSHRYS